MILIKILASAILTCVGSLWTDKLYSKCAELTFPNEISSRSRWRKPFLFIALAIFICMTENFWIMTAIFFLLLMTATDFEQYMLFDARTLPLALLGIIFSYQENFPDAILAAFVGGGFFFVARDNF